RELPCNDRVSSLGELLRRAQIARACEWKLALRNESHYAAERIDRVASRPISIWIVLRDASLALRPQSHRALAAAFGAETEIGGRRQQREIHGRAVDQLEVRSRRQEARASSSVGGCTGHEHRPLHTKRECV